MYIKLYILSLYTQVSLAPTHVSPSVSHTFYLHSVSVSVPSQIINNDIVVADIVADMEISLIIFWRISSPLNDEPIKFRKQFRISYFFPSQMAETTFFRFGIKQEPTFMKRI